MCPAFAVGIFGTLRSSRYYDDDHHHQHKEQHYPTHPQGPERGRGWCLRFSGRVAAKNAT